MSPLLTLAGIWQASRHDCARHSHGLPAKMISFNPEIAQVIQIRYFMIAGKWPRYQTFGSRCNIDRTNWPIVSGCHHGP
eukprot:3231410-Amphidinium_carterae.1